MVLHHSLGYLHTIAHLSHPPSPLLCSHSNAQRRAEEMTAARRRLAPPAQLSARQNSISSSSSARRPHTHLTSLPRTPRRHRRSAPAARLPRHRPRPAASPARSVCGVSTAHRLTLPTVAHPRIGDFPRSYGTDCHPSWAAFSAAATDWPDREPWRLPEPQSSSELLREEEKQRQLTCWVSYGDDADCPLPWFDDLLGDLKCALPPGLLPAGLRVLLFNEDYNQPVQPGALPSTLTDVPLRALSDCRWCEGR